MPMGFLALGLVAQRTDLLCQLYNHDSDSNRFYVRFKTLYHYDFKAANIPKSIQEVKIPGVTKQ